MNEQEVTVTIKDVASRLGVDYAFASGYVNMLVVKGIAKKAGSAPKTEGHKGKAANLFTIPKIVTIELKEASSEEVPVDSVV